MLAYIVDLLPYFEHFGNAVGVGSMLFYTNPLVECPDPVEDKGQSEIEHGVVILEGQSRLALALRSFAKFPEYSGEQNPLEALHEQQRHRRRRRRFLGMGLLRKQRKLHRERNNARAATGERALSASINKLMIHSLLHHLVHGDSF